MSFWDFLYRVYDKDNEGGPTVGIWLGFMVFIIMGFRTAAVGISMIGESYAIEQKSKMMQENPELVIRLMEAHEERRKTAVQQIIHLAEQGELRNSQLDKILSILKEYSKEDFLTKRD